MKLPQSFLAALMNTMIALVLASVGAGTMMAQTFAYVANGFSDDVTGYVQNPTTGALTPIAGMPVAAGDQPEAVVVDPLVRFAYVANAASGNVSAYTINQTTGLLTPVTGSPFAAGVGPTPVYTQSLVIDPTGRFLYASNFLDNSISGSITAFSINQTTGALTLVGNSLTPSVNLPHSVTIDPAGKFVYAANYNSGTVSIFSVNPATGALTFLPAPVPTGGANPRGLTLDPTGKFLFVVNDTTNTVTTFSVNSATGALTAVGMPTPTGGTLPRMAAVDPTGKFLFIPNVTSNNVSVFMITPGTGVLVPVIGSPFTVPNGPFALTVDPTGKFVYVTSGASNVVSVLSVNPASGVLTALPTVPNISNPVWVTLASVPKKKAYLVRYVSNLAIGDSVVNMTNDGSSSTGDNLSNATANFQQDGQLCANVYAYSPDEQLVSCCSCNVTPNGLNSLSAKNDLASNTLTPIIPSALVIKIVVTKGGSTCSASSAGTISRLDLAEGLMAWGTTIHALPVTPGSPATTYGLGETAFSTGQLSDAELNRMKSLCAFIRANGSGYGICKSCKIGGLGASAR